MSATETMTTLPPASNAGAIIPGLYIGELVSIKDAGRSKFPNEKTGEYDEQVCFTWKIRKVLDTEADNSDSLVGTQISRYPKKIMGPRSNMRLYAEAHLGRKLEDAESLNVAAIVGTFAKISVIQKDGDRGVETHVTLTPHKKGEKAALVAKPEPVEDEDLDF